MVKTALNARVIFFGKAQTDKDGIIRCAIAISNFYIGHVPHAYMR